MTFFARDKRHKGLLVLGLAIAVSACFGDPDAATGPTPPTVDFSRYVALGNSLTAGVQSAGINDSTQGQAYPVLLAQSMGLVIGNDFIYPSLAGSGCPPPIVNVFTGSRVGGGLATDCSGRVNADLPHNLGIPGADVADLLATANQVGAPRQYTTVLLDDRTQLDVAMELQPTFVSAWIGNNDVLGALSGDVSFITDFDKFKSDLDEVVQIIDAMAPTGAVLIGVPNILNIPNLSPGAAYWVVGQMGLLPPGVTVAANCATAKFGGVGETTLVPFAYGFGVVFATPGSTLDCLADPEVINAVELVQVLAAVGRFNTAIEREANTRGWAFWNPNGVLDSLRAAGELPLFPNTSMLNDDWIERPFGDFFSRDGVHITAVTSNLAADHIIDAINAKYGSELTKP